MADGSLQMDIADGDDVMAGAGRFRTSRALRFLRRLHLYLGIALVPWFFMYAIGAFVINHRPLVNGWFQSDKPDWIERCRKEYHRPVPADADTRQVGAAILRDFGMGDRAYWSWWQNGNRSLLAITAFRFLSSTRLLYHVDQGWVVVEDQPFRLDRFFVGMHERGGFLQSPWLNKAWGVICDIVGLAVLTWAISGLYIWWKTHRRHLAGGLVLAAGVIGFVVIVAYL